MKTFQDFLHIMDFNGNQTVQGPFLSHLVPIEVHYMENNPGMFSSKTFISFRLKKERRGHPGWHGGE